MVDTILWRRIDVPGHEFGRLAPREDGWVLSGTAVFVHELRPCMLHYVIRCASDWRTVSAWVGGNIGEEEVGVDVAVDDERRWWVNGIEYPGVRGCMDIDLGFSPSTNLLPIRRLAPGIGEEAAVRAAWLPFPSLTLERLDQVYRREAEMVYRYKSGGGRFTRTLEVNATGFVTVYPGLWQAEAAA